MSQLNWILDEKIYDKYHILMNFCATAAQNVLYGQFVEDHAQNTIRMIDMDSS